MAYRYDRSLRNELDRSFRPLFEAHEVSGGIPMRDLRDHLQDNTTLPRRKVNTMLHSADENRDGRITYDEFVVQMTREDASTLRKLGRGKRFLNGAVRIVQPGRRRVRTYDADETDTLNWGEENVDNYIEAYNCRPPPLFIPIITLAEIGVFAYYAYKLNTDSDPGNDVTALKGCDLMSPLVFNPKRRVEAWRFVSYMLMHSGYTHIVFNCALQIVLGVLLEMVHKFWRVGIVYILGVIAGSLANSVFDPYVYLVGASGGCYALIGAHFAIILMNWEEMQDDWLSNPIKFISSGVFRLFILLLLGGGDTGLAIYNRFATGGSKVGFAAHGGGFVAGVLIGVPVLKNLDVKSWEKVAFWVCLVLYLLFTLAAILFNGFCEMSNMCPKNEVKINF